MNIPISEFSLNWVWELSNDNILSIFLSLEAFFNSKLVDLNNLTNEFFI